VKRIVVCYDGTWNALTDPATITNVVRLGQAVKKLAEDGTHQVVYYNAGVGSGGPLDRFLGGVFGVGLRNNVKRGLAFLTLNWNPEGNDEIYIFGFSRGAYSARALAGVIGAIRGIPKQEYFDRLEEIWKYYRTDHSKRTEEMETTITGYLHGGGGMPPKISCLGVWDTVGSYGIPEGLGLGALARKVTSWTRGFHDNTISGHVKVGLHAMAIDERRRAFPTTAWVPPEGKTVESHVEQVWFAGSHSNIGGGYPRSGLADLALIWMIARVKELTALDFDKAYVAKNFWPCAACSLYNSNRGWLLSTFRPNQRPVLAGSFVNEKVHWSAIERLNRLGIVDESRNIKYAPPNVPKDLPDDRKPNAFDDPRVAKMTELEDELIRACRDAGGKRIDNCALFCELSSGDERAGVFSRAVSFVRDKLSTERRRERRQRLLRDMWGIKPARRVEKRTP
jgi:hypothetical protein